MKKKLTEKIAYSYQTMDGSANVNDLIEVQEKISIRQMMKEIEELEPKNIVDYIFRGSGLNQWARKNLKLKI